MISVLALDPTTLSLNVDLGSLTADGNGSLLLEVFWEAYSGDNESLKKKLLTINDVELRQRACHLASSVWHEKRHFLDYLLTNYGALRIRQYFSIYSNFHLLVEQAKRHGGVLWMPLTTYLDPCKKILHQIQNDWPKDLAQNILNATQLFQGDQETRTTSKGERAQFGGEAQFEAFGWGYQIASAQQILGLELAQEAHKDLLRFGAAGQVRYRWMEQIGSHMGIYPVFEQNGGYIGDASFILPLILASLQIRAYGQTRNVPQSRFSAAASTRLFTMLEVVKGLRLKFGELSFEDSWELVNKLCAKLWGRSAIEEMEEDYRQEEEFLAQLSTAEMCPTEVRSAYAEYHSLRGSLIELLKCSPGSILDPSSFTANVLPSLHPTVILFSANGTLGDAPKDYEVIQGYQDDDPAHQCKWWWAITPTTNPFVHAESLAFKDSKGWSVIASMIGPLTKLALNGRAHRTTIGAEFYAVEQRLTLRGINIEVDAYYRYPREDPREQMEIFYLLAGRRIVNCDLCSRKMNRPDGRLLQHWLFWHNDVTHWIAVKGFTPDGASLEVGKEHFLRDWSPWTCCDACFDALSEIPDFRAACDATFA